MRDEVYDFMKEAYGILEEDIKFVNLTFEIADFISTT